MVDEQIVIEQDPVIARRTPAKDAIGAERDSRDAQSLQTEPVVTTDFPGLITLLSAGGVEFIVIGVSRPPSMDLPFRFDAATIARGLNFTLQTSLGDLDLLGEVAGGGTYDLLLPEAESAMLEGLEFRCVSLRRLILLKRAAGRPKDLNVLAELEALLEEREGSG